MNFDLIDPALHGKFSPDLHKWLTRTRILKEPVKDFYKAINRNPEDFRENPYAPYHTYLGTVFDGDLLGRQVAQILQHPYGKHFSINIKQFDLEPAPEWWEKYPQIGQCLFDSFHYWDFEKRGRFTVEGDHRLCNWCGAEFRLEEKRTVKVSKVWVPHNSLVTV